MKSMKFRGFKATWILDGTKTASLRLFDDKDLQIGDELELINSDTGEVFTHAIVTEVVEKFLSDITDEDLIGHEKYASYDAMLQNLRGHYGDRVTNSTSAKIVHFSIHS